jgi:hypothetical protein
MHCPVDQRPLRRLDLETGLLGHGWQHAVRTKEQRHRLAPQFERQL